jgi:cytochrome c oxidase subunit 2
MTSEDVPHSLSIPALRTKQAVLPGRFTQLWFTPTTPGAYNFFCGEFCGAAHTRMNGTLFVMPAAEYQQWLKGVPAGGGQLLTPVAAGEKLFKAAVPGCFVCHSGLPGALGPKLDGVFGHKVTLADGKEVVADEAYIVESIVNPMAKLVKGYAPVMPPTFKQQLSEEQISQLVAYIKSLGGPAEAKK